VHSALSSAQPTVQQVVGATLRGYTDTLWWAVGGMLLASLIAGLMVMAKAPKDSAPKDSAPKDSGPKDNAPPVPSTGRRNPTPWP
jgi:hypothetical protein